MSTEVFWEQLYESYRTFDKKAIAWLGWYNERMSYPIKSLRQSDFPPLLKEIPEPPAELNYQGRLPSSDLTLLTVVGSRKYTSYGRGVVDYLIGGLKGYPIGIVSGLALGIDALAHQAALKNNLYTLAVPGSGLADTVLYPASNKRLAREILARGGGLLSEFTETQTAAPWTFPRRNRLMAGLAPATLLIEAGEKSGTLITARLAADYNREVLVVPGSIFSNTSSGTHQFLKLGATPITSPEDILEALRIKPTDAATLNPPDLTTDLETVIWAILTEPRTKDDIIRRTGAPADRVAITLSSLEVNGYIVQISPFYRRA